MRWTVDEIWRTGEWQTDWTISEMVTLPKVSGTQECNKHRTLSLISHASKILLDIIRHRVTYFTKNEIGEEQFGFVSEKGTTDAMLVLRNIIEKAEEKSDNELWLMFIGYAKAFDTVRHVSLWEAMSLLAVPKHLTWLIRQLYVNIRVENDHTESFKFEKGVRQGCLLSPMLFN